jgi:RecJ-like exonuclease
LDDPLWNTTILMGIAWAVLSGRRRASEQEYGMLDDDDDAADDFGRRGSNSERRGPVCIECDNTREVACMECRAKGFFVSDDAIPRKCSACAGLGKVRCPECEGRSRRRSSSSSKRERSSRRSLPPSRERELW